MLRLRHIFGAAICALVAACASGAATATGTPRANAAPVGSTLLGERPTCATSTAVEITNPTDHEIWARLWMSDRTTRDLGPVEPRETRQWIVAANQKAVAVTAQGRGFDMVAEGSNIPSAQTGGDIKVPARWVCTT
jgi:hypothetical protein